MRHPFNINQPKSGLTSKANEGENIRSVGKSNRGGGQKNWIRRCGMRKIESGGAGQGRSQGGHSFFNGHFLADLRVLGHRGDQLYET